MQEMVDTEETSLDKAIPSRIVKILQALEEETCVIEVKLPANSTCTLVKALDFSKRQGDDLAFVVRPHLVPKGVVVIRMPLANPKFAKGSAERLQEDQKISGFLRKVARRPSGQSPTMSFVLGPHLLTVWLLWTCPSSLVFF
jgi:hypothetical protein